MWSHTVVTCVEIYWCIITSSTEMKMDVESSFPNTEIAERSALDQALITTYSALSVVLNRNVNYSLA